MLLYQNQIQLLLFEGLENFSLREHVLSPAESDVAHGLVQAFKKFGLVD